MSAPADGNLIFGLLALQMDFVTRDQLLDALHAWMLEKQTPLGDILVRRGVLGRGDRDDLDRLVARHVKRHGDPRASLAALRIDPAVRQALESLPDAEVQRSVAALPPTPEAPDRSVGPPTSDHVPDSPAGVRYRRLRQHARGGLGAVYVALDEELRREVALKEIQEEHADEPDARARFLREAEVTGKLEHPGVVPVYGLGAYPGGRPFYAMRFIRGESMQTALHRFHQADEDPRRDPGERSLALRDLLSRFVAVCQAVAFAHSRGVLHRDIKPANCMLGEYGETLVVDWGLARRLDLPDAERPVLAGSGNGSALTQMGHVVGTIAFMPPEQANGRLDQMGPRSDGFSLGATLYALLTGHAPYEGEDAIVQAALGEVVPARQRKRSVPEALEAVCARAMAAKPEDRYPSAKALAQDVQRWLADEPVSAYREPVAERARRWGRRHRSLVTGGVVLLVAGVAGLSLGLWAVGKEQAATKEALGEAEENLEWALEAEGKAEGEAKKARRLARAEKKQRKEAEKNEKVATMGRHGFQMTAALQAWRQHDVATAEALLDDVHPELQRTWEYRHLRSLCRRKALTLKGHTHPVSGVAFSPDGRRIASGSWDGTVKVWEALTGQQLLTLQGHTGAVISVAFSPDGRRLASGNGDGPVKVWDTSTGQGLLTLKGHTHLVDSVAYSPNGRRVASASQDQTVKLWDAWTGQDLLTLKGHRSWVNSVAFSPDGRRVASASDDGMVKLWDAKTGRDLLTLKGHTAPVTSVAYSPDGRRIASASDDQTVKLWDASSGQGLLTLKGHTSGVRSVAFSPDGRRIASASGDQTVKLWDASTGQDLLTLQGHTGLVSEVAFSPDGRRIASGSGDRTVKVWDASAGQEGLKTQDRLATISPVDRQARLSRPRG
jgi:tRNA A-37 threonylcarbamoyl transferase component Bud32